jgi:multiple sugar transport system permease protein
MTVPIGLSMFRMENITMYTYIMAGSVISLIPVIVVYIFTQKYLVQGIALTGLKA